MTLDTFHLREILSKIRPTQNQQDFYHSKWIRIVHFLYNSTGYAISKVAKGGSQGKKTEIYKSDFDIIFACSDQYIHSERFDDLFHKLQENFSEATNRIIQKDQAVYLEFPTDYSYDVVLVAPQEFDHELEHIRDVRRADIDMLNTIRLCKYACSQMISLKIKSYQIEKKVIRLYKAGQDLANNTYRGLQSISSICKIEPKNLMKFLL